MRYLISSREFWTPELVQFNEIALDLLLQLHLPTLPPLFAHVALIAALSLHILAILSTEMKYNDVYYHVNYYYAKV